MHACIIFGWNQLKLVIIPHSCLAAASGNRVVSCGLQKASVATERVSATLNAGQSVVLTIGLTAVLALAASGGTGAAVTAGDLVCSSSLRSLPASVIIQNKD